MRLSVELEWSDVGEIRLEDGALVFPKVPALPGVYRFSLVSSAGERVYIGEASLLRRRLQHYRTPGPTQRTNIRLNALLRELLASGGLGEVAVVTSATINVEGEAFQADLGHRVVRLLIESAALVAVGRTGTPVENL